MDVGRMNIDNRGDVFRDIGIVGDNSSAKCDNDKSSSSGIDGYRGIGWPYEMDGRRQSIIVTWLVPSFRLTGTPPPPLAHLTLFPLVLLPHRSHAPSSHAPASSLSRTRTAHSSHAALIMRALG